MSKLIYPLFTLVGTIIGVGFFALPFLIWKIGILTLLLYFLVLGYVVKNIHSFYAQIALWTPQNHRLPGYAKIYLGEKAEKIAAIQAVISFAGTLLAYLVVGGGFLNNLFNSFLKTLDFAGPLIFFVLGAFLIILGIRPIAKIELLAFLIFVAVLAVIFKNGFPFWNLTNLFNFDKSWLFAPWGVVLFSLSGASLMPEIVEMVGRDQKLVQRIVLLSIIICSVFYLLFSMVIVGITGSLTTADALSALPYFFENWILALAFFLGFLTCFTSFITLGLTLKKILAYDFYLPEKFALSLSLGVPLILYFLGLDDFLLIISLIGAFLLGIEGILIVLIFLKAKEKFEGLKIFSGFLSKSFFKNILGPIFILIMLFLGILFEINNLLIR
jgi:amino acid permease